MSKHDRIAKNGSVTIRRGRIQSSEVRKNLANKILEARFVPELIKPWIEAAPYHPMRSLLYRFA
jgi:hypothetical protein